jgi:hypothetical protein
VLDPHYCGWYPRLALATAVTCAPAQSNRPPRFAGYPVSEIYSGAVKPPQFGDLNRYSGTDLRCYGEDPTYYATKRVNFAGRFVIGVCPCGSGCHYLYMWDASSGKVHLAFPSMPIDVGPFGDGVVSPHIMYKGEEYRLDSSLLILEGCVEETCDCGRRYYNWNGSQFRLVLKAPTPMPPSCRK